MSQFPVLLFASYADALGARRLTVEAVVPCRVADLVSIVRTRPGGQIIPPVPLVAVNHVWVDTEHVVQAGDEVAIIPPVAGG